eukprot:2561672-Rhodomonas_salina.1
MSVGQHRRRICHIAVSLKSVNDPMGGNRKAVWNMQSPVQGLGLVLAAEAENQRGDVEQHAHDHRRERDDLEPIQLREALPADGRLSSTVTRTTQRSGNWRHHATGPAWYKQRRSQRQRKHADRGLECVVSTSARQLGPGKAKTSREKTAPIPQTCFAAWQTEHGQGSLSGPAESGPTGGQSTSWKLPSIVAIICQKLHEGRKGNVSETRTKDLRAKRDGNPKPQSQSRCQLMASTTFPIMVPSPDEDLGVRRHASEAHLGPATPPASAVFEVRSSMASATHKQTRLLWAGNLGLLLGEEGLPANANPHDKEEDDEEDEGDEEHAVGGGVSAGPARGARQRVPVHARPARADRSGQLSVACSS